jgi:demethylmenaquinone methyltransferase/2-methoxy-6-polyprenyl-1,4-benzoquinol methylase
MAIKPEATAVQSMFNRIGAKYDPLNDWLSFGQHHIWKLMAVKWSAPIAGGKGLDICCGTGDLTQLLHRKIGDQGETVGLDFSGELLTIAQQKYPQLPITWQEGNALDLPFRDDYFDCVTMGYGLRNVLDIPQCLREIKRVLKTGGKAAILDFNRPRSPLMNQAQQWYLDYLVVPLAARMNLKTEYEYIFPSLQRFPLGHEQVNLALDAGFIQAIHYPIAAGLMGVLVLQA